MLSVLKAANLALAFGLELAMLGALAAWGITTGDSVLSRWLLGLGSPVLAAVLWGVWLAPRSDVRLPMPWLVVVQLLIFAVAAVALYGSGRPRLAFGFAVLVAISESLAVLWHQQ